MHGADQIRHAAQHPPQHRHPEHSRFPVPTPVSGTGNRSRPAALRLVLTGSGENLSDRSVGKLPVAGNLPIRSDRKPPPDTLRDPAKSLARSGERTPGRVRSRIRPHATPTDQPTPWNGRGTRSVRTPRTVAFQTRPLPAQGSPQSGDPWQDRPMDQTPEQRPMKRHPMHHALEHRPHAPGVCSQRTPRAAWLSTRLARTRAREATIPAGHGTIPAYRTVRTACGRSDGNAVTCGVACVRYRTVTLPVRSTVP